MNRQGKSRSGSRIQNQSSWPPRGKTGKNSSLTHEKIANIEFLKNKFCQFLPVFFIMQIRITYQKRMLWWLYPKLVIKSFFKQDFNQGKILI